MFGGWKYLFVSLNSHEKPNAIPRIPNTVFALAGAQGISLRRNLRIGADRPLDLQDDEVLQLAIIDAMT
jgi:hypothetical protein